MKFITEIEGYDLISTGSIVGAPGKILIFKIEDLVFEFEFKDNKDFVEHKITSTVPEDGKKMRVLFENFNSGLGMGNNEPAEIGYIGKRKIYLNYRIYSLTEGSGKLVHYTWLIDKEEGVINGK